MASSALSGRVAIGTRRGSSKPVEDMNAEEVMDAVDSWVDEQPGREYKVRKNLLGNVATLFSGGNPVAVGRGRGSVNAIANALESYRDSHAGDRP